MQFRTRIVAWFLALIACSTSLGQEVSRSWWPFGDDDSTAESSTTSSTPPQRQQVIPASAAQISNEAATRTTVRPTLPDPPTSFDADDSWLPKPSLPAIHMPEFSLPKLPDNGLFGREPESSNENRWYEPHREMPAPSTWDTMKGGVRRMSIRTRSAWDRTIDVFTPDEDEEPIARREPPKPPFWKRMFGVDEEIDEGPQTVTEWMAQDRLSP